MGEVQTTGVRRWWARIVEHDPWANQSIYGSTGKFSPTWAAGMRLWLRVGIVVALLVGCFGPMFFAGVGGRVLSVVIALAVCVAGVGVCWTVPTWRRIPTKATDLVPGTLFSGIRSVDSETIEWDGFVHTVAAVVQGEDGSCWVAFVDGGVTHIPVGSTVAEVVAEDSFRRRPMTDIAEPPLPTLTGGEYLAIATIWDSTDARHAPRADESVVLAAFADIEVARSSLQSVVDQKLVEKRRGGARSTVALTEAGRVRVAAVIAEASPTDVADLPNAVETAIREGKIILSIEGEQIQVNIGSPGAIQQRDHGTAQSAFTASQVDAALDDLLKSTRDVMDRLDPASRTAAEPLATELFAAVHGGSATPEEKRTRLRQYLAVVGNVASGVVASATWAAIAWFAGIS